jgi:hypothetical protein
MNRKIRQMEKEIERRGGIIGGNPSVPDEIYARFLEQILDCPDCREEGANNAFENPSRSDGH